MCPYFKIGLCRWNQVKMESSWTLVCPNPMASAPNVGPDNTERSWYSSGVKVGVSYHKPGKNQGVAWAAFISNFKAPELRDY
jgi:hypothetical protein